MATAALSATLGQSLGGGVTRVASAGIGSVSGSVDTTALDAAIAAAVAIGAGDASAEIAEIAAQAALLTGTATVSGDVSIVYNDAVATNINKLEDAVRALLQAARASGRLPLG